MAETKQTPGEAIAAAAAETVAEADAPYEPKPFEMTINGRVCQFTTIEQTEIKRDGKTTTKEDYDFVLPAVSDGDYDGAFTWLKWQLSEHDAREKGSGWKHVKRQIHSLMEPANEVLTGPNGEEDYDAFGKRITEPVGKSGNSAGALNKKLIELQARTGALHVITKEKDPSRRDQLVRSIGYTEIVQVLTEIDSLVQRINELLRQQAEMAAAKAAREAKKQRRLQEAMAAAASTPTAVQA